MHVQHVYFADVEDSAVTRHAALPAAAGQSAVGESFLMGQGPAGSANSGQWAAVCALMSAPLPGEGRAAV
jgi:hypothetical protein